MLDHGTSISLGGGEEALVAFGMLAFDERVPFNCMVRNDANMTNSTT